MTKRPIARPFAGPLCLGTALLATCASLLAGCEKKTTVTQTPSGTVTTTTVSPSLQASAALGKLDAALHGASAAGIELRTVAERADQEASQAATRVGDVVDDGVITTKIKAAFVADPEVKAMSIDVDTHDGVVTLAGTADTAAGLARAARIARATSGVKAVRNQLSVKAH